MAVADRTSVGDGSQLDLLMELYDEVFRLLHSGLCKARLQN